MRNKNTVYTSRRRQNLINSRSYGRNANITIFEPSKKLGMVSRALMFAGFFCAIRFDLCEQCDNVDKLRKRNSRTGHRNC